MKLPWSKNDEQKAEEFLREHETDEAGTSGAIRHYIVSEVTDYLELNGIRVTDQQTARAIGRIRDDYGYGPIDPENMPGYVSKEDGPEYEREQQNYNAYREARDTDVERDQQSQRGLFGWLFG